MYRILTEPVTNILRQQAELLSTEQVKLEFTEEAKREIARVASLANKTIENIGARRLHTVLERIVEELSFSAPERYSKFVADGGSGQLEVKVDVEDIDKAIGSMLKQEDLSRFVL